MVSFWLFGFLLSLAFEFVISENVRVFGRIVLLWALKSTRRNMPEVEMTSMDEPSSQRLKPPKTFSFSEG
jgi:hypothetical protein